MNSPLRLHFKFHHSQLRVSDETQFLEALNFPKKQRLKTVMQLDYLGGGELGDSQKRKAKEQTLVKTIVVLIRNTTWRCGKVEKSIVEHLCKRNRNFGKPGVSIRDIMQSLNFTGTKKDECIDAIKRLEKRNIVKIFPL